MSQLLPFHIDKGHLTEQPILDIRDLVNWKKTRKVYNFDKLPSTAILSIFALPKQRLQFWKIKKLKGITGENYLLKKENCLFCAASTNGAPAIVMLCEELRALGVERFIFIGLGASMIEQLEVGDIVFVEEAFAGTGANYYYQETSRIQAERQAISTINLEHNDLNISSVKVWSTDAPFRETKSLRDYYLGLGASVVEMETAGIYAFANYYGLTVSSCLIISDHLFDQWSPPKDIQLVQQQFRELFYFIKEKIKEPFS